MHVPFSEQGESNAFKDLSLTDIFMAQDLITSAFIG